MENKKLKWLCYYTALALVLLCAIAYIQMHRYEDTQYYQIKYDKLLNRNIKIHQVNRQ